LQDNNIETLDALPKNTADGYAILAEIQKGSALIESEKWQEAQALFATLANNSSYAPVYTDMAKLYQAQIMLNQGSDEIVPLLQTLISSESAFKLSALELLGNYYEGKGDYASAADYYTQIATTSTVPSGLKVRVQKRMDIINRATRK